METVNRNRCITVQRKTVAANSLNEPIETWTDDTQKVYAAVITTGGGEFYAAQKLYAETTVLFKLAYTSYTSTIKTDNRIKYGARIFEILAPPNDVNGAHMEINIAAKEVV